MQYSAIKKKEYEVDREGRIIAYPALYDAKKKSMLRLIRQLFAIKKSR